ncbi:hypothetical protein V0288_09505 [Pannus brasiliensis CCIBt3594]|uniref:Isopropylmalate/homocitrate/citramalate synthases n=1 Tax=Pannus brasiliensis CCIBt3594 TaxID=1427578 RepID=A0AAW9QJS1_9CHRO
MTQPSNDENNPRRPDREKENFLFPRSRYYGEFKPENLAFNANLQEFAQKVSYICNLETAGKISNREAYKKIKALWRELKQSKIGLGIGKDGNENDAPDNEP